MPDLLNHPVWQQRSLLHSIQKSTPTGKSELVNRPIFRHRVFAENARFVTLKVVYIIKILLALSGQGRTVVKAPTTQFQRLAQPAPFPVAFPYARPPAPACPAPALRLPAPGPAARLRRAVPRRPPAGSGHPPRGRQHAPTAAPARGRPAARWPPVAGSRLAHLRRQGALVGGQCAAPRLARPPRRRGPAPELLPARSPANQRPGAAAAGW